MRSKDRWLTGPKGVIVDTVAEVEPALDSMVVESLIGVAIPHRPRQRDLARKDFIGVLAMSATDKPQPLRVNIGLTKVITLRVEPAGLLAGTFGEWIDPMVLR